MNFEIQLISKVLMPLLKDLVKNPERKKTLKKVLLTVWTLIGDAYWDDADFQRGFNKSLRRARTSFLS